MGNDPRYAGRRHGRLDRHGDAAARVAVQIKHLVLVDELLGRGDPLGRIAGGVLLDDLELAPINSALVVDVLEVGHEPDLRLTVARRIARKRSHDPDLDGRVRQAGGLIGVGRADHRQDAHDGERDYRFLDPAVHVSSPVCSESFLFFSGGLAHAGRRVATHLHATSGHLQKQAGAQCRHRTDSKL